MIFKDALILKISSETEESYVVRKKIKSKTVVYKRQHHDFILKISSREEKKKNIKDDRIESDESTVSFYSKSLRCKLGYRRYIKNF